jgi:AcrR family transcriptional regulator
MLRDALLELILEHGYDSITVQQITDRANLGRATFYLHYNDKEELLFSSWKDTVDELATKLSPATSAGMLDGSKPPSLIAFQHAAENRQLFRVLLNAQANSTITTRLRALIAQVVEAQIKHLISPDLLPIPLEIIGQHAAGSLIALLAWWLETESTYTPEQMAQMMNFLNVQPLLLSFTSNQPTTKS